MKTKLTKVLQVKLLRDEIAVSCKRFGCRNYEECADVAIQAICIYVDAAEDYRMTLLRRRKP